MMLKTSVLLALAALAFGKVDYTGYRVFRAYPSLEQLETIQSMKEKYNLDIWAEYSQGSGFIDFMVAPQFRPVVESTLKHFRIKYGTFIEDVEVAARAQVPDGRAIGDLKYDQYNTLEQIYTWMDKMISTYSNIQGIEEGISAEGRPIRGLKITSTSGGMGKPSFVINCGIHSREWVSPATCIYTVNRLVTTDASLLSDIDIYIIPSANPDGYVYTWDHDRMWRKTRNTTAGNRCVGADPNRNFDAAWGTEGSSTNSCFDTYQGPFKFSEVESKSHADFVTGLGTVKAYIDVHAYSQLWMYPYGYTTNKCADDATLGTIASDSVAAIKSVHGKTYRYGPISTTIYPASGSTADYFYDAGIKCSFAAELRDTGTFGFTLPEALITPTAEETFAAFEVMANAVVSGQCD